MLRYEYETTHSGEVMTESILSPEQQEAAEHDAWFRRQVEAGIKSAATKDLIPAEDVEARFAAKRAATRRQLESDIPE